MSSIIRYSGHDDEVLDVAFDYTGERIVTASSDGKFVLRLSEDLLVVRWSNLA